MRTDPLQSVAVEILRQALEQLSTPALVVDSATDSIVVANAAARGQGFAAAASATEELSLRVSMPWDEREYVLAAMHGHRAALLRWTGKQGPKLLRATPIEGDHGKLLMITWEDQRNVDPGPERFLVAQRRLHDWLARTPVTRANLGDVIRDLTERLCKLYDLERASVWLFSEDNRELTCRDLFVRSKGEHESGCVLHAADCATEFETLRRSLYVDVHDTSSDPRAASYRESYLEPHKISSMLDATIRFGGRCYGTLCLEHVGTRHTWGLHEVDFACTIASYLATALESLARSEAVSLARERERFLHTLVEGSPVGIQVFAPDGTSRRMNRAMQLILGLPSTTHDIGSYNLLNDPQAQSSGLDVVFREAAAGRPGRIERYEVDYGTEGFDDEDRRRDPFWLESVFFPVLDHADEVEAVVVFAWEVTDRVRAEERQRSLEEQLRQSQKLDAVGKLAGGVAHDFNNVLTAIQGFSEMLAMSLDGDEDRLELVDQVRQGAHRGTALIQQLLAFGQRQVPQVEVFDAGTAVVEMLPMLRRLLEANIKVDVTASCSAPIRADRQQLQQVLLNLFVNARDAMRRSGGTITASIDRVDGGEHGTMALTVQDDGEGMDEPTLARAFEPFFTTKADGAGTGLGLSTVRDIVTEAGGSITAESAPGKGTTMRVLWPLTDEPPAPEPEPEPDSLHAQPGQRVLVVDDEDSNRELATRVLSRFGYEVVSAPDGEAALEIAASDDQIDVVVTDVVMPGIGGRLLAEEIVALRPDMRIVFTSGFTSDDVLRTRVRADLVKFLPKPYTADDLAAIVARALAD